MLRVASWLSSNLESVRFWSWVRFRGHSSPLAVFYSEDQFLSTVWCIYEYCSTGWLHCLSRTSIWYSVFAEIFIEPIWDIPFHSCCHYFSAKRISSLAALSCWFHRDKVKLWTWLSFLPKVLFLFSHQPDCCVDVSLSQVSHARGKLSLSIECCSFCQLVPEINCCALSVYLIVLPEGPRKGYTASTSTILDLSAYGLKGKVSLFLVRAHSTKSVIGSWPVWYPTSIGKAFKAATWSLVHTFTNCCHLNVKGTEDAFFWAVRFARCCMRV